MHQRCLKAVVVAAAVGTLPIVTSNVIAQSCCSGPSTPTKGATAERPSRASVRVEKLLDREGGREALLLAAMGDERFMADYMNAITQDPERREHAAQLVREEPEGSASRKQQAMLYTCPMHPEVTSDWPGKCPKCGMALERRAARAASHRFDGRVRRTAEQLVRDERHRDKVIDVLVNDQAFTDAWIVAVASDSRWREKGLQAWAGKGQGSSTERPERSSRTTAYYTCSMHPEVISDRPGQCPKCGMTLERRTR